MRTGRTLHEAERIAAFIKKNFPVTHLPRPPRPPSPVQALRDACGATRTGKQKTDLRCLLGEMDTFTSFNRIRLKKKTTITVFYSGVLYHGNGYWLDRADNGTLTLMNAGKIPDPDTTGKKQGDRTVSPVTLRPFTGSDVDFVISRQLALYKSEYGFTSDIWKAYLTDGSGHL